MRNERTYAYHVRREFLEESEVGNYVVRCLIRGSYHEPASNLIADFLQGEKAFLPPAQTHGIRVKMMLVGFVGRLMPEKIAVCP